MTIRDLRTPFKSWLFDSGARLCSVEAETEGGTGAEALAAGEQGDPQETADAAPADTEAENTEATAEGEQPEGDTDEEFDDLDLEGTAFKVHKDLKKAIEAGTLRQADYTQKTQALADDRRTFEQHATTQLQQMQHREAALVNVEDAAKSVSNERVQLEIASTALQQFDQAIDAAFAQGDRALVEDLKWQRQAWERQHASAKTKFDTAEQQLAQQRQALSVQAEESRKAAIARGVDALKADPAVKLDQTVYDGAVAFAGSYGIAPEEVFNVALADPRMFKVLKVAADAVAKLAKIEAEQGARNRVAPPSAKPASKVNGAVRATSWKTTDASGDRVPMDAWAKADLARSRRAPS